jgi:hypothetical protein
VEDAEARERIAALEEKAEQHGRAIAIFETSSRSSRRTLAGGNAGTFGFVLGSAKEN